MKRLAQMPGVRAGAVALSLMPPWVAYLLALIGWLDGGWADPETLKLGMRIEYLSVILFPFLGGLAMDPRPPRAIRVVIFLALAFAVTTFIGDTLGWRSASLFWLGCGVTYAGWLWAPPGESGLRPLLSRAILTLGCLVLLIFTVIVVAKMTRADEMLLMGFLYFLALHALDATGTFARFHRWFEGASHPQ